MDWLQVLVIEGDPTDMTLAGIARLRRAIPKCRIEILTPILPIDADKSLTRGKKATVSSIARESAAGNAVDGNAKTFWAAGPVRKAFLEVDLGEAATFGRCYLSEGKRVREFELLAFRDGNWETVHKGKQIGPNLDFTFAPVKAQRVRLNIVSIEGFAIREFMLFAP